MHILFLESEMCLPTCIINFSISTGDQRSLWLWSVGHWFPLSKSSKVILACKILELVLTQAFHTLITVWIMKICLVATCTWYIIAYISSIIPMCRAEGFNICSWEPGEKQNSPKGLSYTKIICSETCYKYRHAQIFFMVWWSGLVKMSQSHGSSGIKCILIY